jgi:hypothetical protein
MGSRLLIALEADGEGHEILVRNSQWEEREREREAQIRRH